MNEWHLFAHPLFLAQVDKLKREVEALYQKDAVAYKNKRASKYLAAIYTLIFDEIPQNPALPRYHQGKTLGDGHKHWRRARFFGQYRLFFRYHQESRIIVFAWVNDEGSKRAYGSRQDAYLTFKRMLNKGNPPDDWESLLNAATKLRAENVIIS